MIGKYSTALTLVLVSTASGLSSQLYGAIITAKSVSLVDVRSAVGSAKDGDTVKVPEGVGRWDATLDVTNNIILAGGGAEKTVIINDIRRDSGVQRPESSERRGSREPVFQRPGQPGQRQKALNAKRQRSALISISLVRNLPFRLTGFTFRGGAETETTFNGEIRIRGSSRSFRIDHCTFDQLHGANLTIKGFLWGVIDHCQFNLARQQPMQIGHETWNGGDHGNGSWADDPHWGTEKFVFIEDNVFDNATGDRRAIDGYEGARFVVRYNQFHNSGVTNHGTEGQGRGAKQVEEYNNVFRFDRGQAGAQIRSGCIITHDNTWINATKGHVLQAYRQFQYSPHWGIANGQNPYDDNAPKETVGYWETGRHTGANGATVLTDSTKKWAVNQWYAPGATFIVRNITQKAAAANPVDTLQSFAISNTANTITCSVLRVTGKRLTFNTGDTYQIWKIAHSLDQPGLGKGELLAGLPGRPAIWPKQITEPCYSWNNLSKEDGRAINLSSTEPSIKEGRDFFNGTPKPDYKPYVYPHPLVK